MRTPTNSSLTWLVTSLGFNSSRLILIDPMENQAAQGHVQLYIEADIPSKEERNHERKKQTKEF